MKLSVVIVSYNVKHFLEQCLHSVCKAMEGLPGEVFVVDNHSVDGSVEMVRQKFPNVHLIVNDHNAGFARANNQALQLASGQYVLLLNPDTVVQEDTFKKTIHFMDEHPEAGALGVYMIDGKGRFLPESKRGLPTPAVAFWKIIGLARLFPKSRLFGRYHLGFLDKEQIHPVDVLSGAFMLLRKSVLEQTGYLDESFFMYGEDIDLSYRILKAGYRNYYYPHTRIIHYKGESTRKSSINYVLVFYRAMVTFVRKHFSQRHAAFFSMLIHLAIWGRAAMAMLARVLNKTLLPVGDALLFYSGMILLTNYWETSVKALNYPPLFENVIIPLYVLIWLIGIFLSGGYDKPIRRTRVLRGIVSGTIFILIVYALLPETLRFSRALILIGTFWAGFSALVWRTILYFSGFRSIGLYSSWRKRIIIVADREEGNRILAMLNLSGAPFNFIGFARIHDPTADPYSIGHVSQLSETVSIYQADELIFSSKDLTLSEIMELMQGDLPDNTEFKMAPPESLFIIGSNSIEQQGNFYMVDINAFSDPVNRRKKRIFDLAASLILLMGTPLLMLFFRSPLTWIKNAFCVLGGKYTWVGIQEKQGRSSFIKQGIFSPSSLFTGKITDENLLHRLVVLYLKEYDVTTDAKILWHHLKHNKKL
jgi:GT2 family glycosyltransferase